MVSLSELLTNVEELPDGTALRFAPASKPENQKLIWRLNEGSYVLANAHTFARQAPAPLSAVAERNLHFWSEFIILGTVPVADIPREGYATTKDLKARGWTDALIERFLGEPDRRVTGFYARGPKVKQYLWSRVEAVEKTAEFQQALAEAARHKQKASRSRQEKLLAKIAELNLPERASLFVYTTGDGHAELRGDTYLLAPILKGLGLSYDGERRIWTGPADVIASVQTAFAARKASLEPVYQAQRLRQEAERRARAEQLAAQRARAEEEARKRRASEPPSDAERRAAEEVSLDHLVRYEPLSLQIDQEAASVSGVNTYPLRHLFRNWGFRWNGSAWVTDRLRAAQELVGILNQRIHALADADPVCYVETVGEGFGGREREIGETFLTPDGKAVTVVRREKRYYREDGLSFGVGADRGHVFIHYCRPATPEEEQALRKRLAEEADRQRNLRRWFELKDLFRRTGTFPPRQDPEVLFSPSARRLLDTQNILGGGDWFILDPERKQIWFVQGNSADGDDWSRNNIGSTALGWYLPWDDSLAEELERLDKLIDTKPWCIAGC